MRRILEHSEETLCVLILAFMAALAFLNVLARYLVGYPLAFTEEVEVNLLVWLTLLGAAVGFKKGAHLGLAFLRERFPRPVQKTAILGSAFLTVSLFFFLIVLSIGQLQEERVLHITSEALQWPQWWYTLGMPVGATLAMVRVVQAAVNQLRRAEE